MVRISKHVLAVVVAAGMCRAGVTYAQKDQMQPLDYGRSYIANSSPANSVRFGIGSPRSQRHRPIR